LFFVDDVDAIGVEDVVAARGGSSLAVCGRVRFRSGGRSRGETMQFYGIYFPNQKTFAVIGMGSRREVAEAVASICDEKVYSAYRKSSPQ